MTNLRLHFSIVGAIVLFFAGNSLAQDIGPEEIFAKHIAAIGGKEKLASLKNRVVAGTSNFESKMPSRKAAGKAMIASDGQNLMFLASFASQEYPLEKIGYFNGKTSLPFVTSGARSPLGSFLLNYEKVLSEGLFSGAMSATWAPLRGEFSSARVRSGGTKKVDGKKAFVVEYEPKGLGSEFTIRLLFDAENFNHVRTEYQHTVSPTENKAGIMGVQGGVKVTLVESFADFRKEGDFTFPYSYKAEYKTESNSGTFEYVWTVDIGAYNFDQNLADGFFTFNEK